jgi:hypothetical protein
MEAKNAAPRPMIAKWEEVRRSVIKIGRPGYKVRSLDERFDGIIEWREMDRWNNRQMVVVFNDL